MIVTRQSVSRSKSCCCNSLAEALQPWYNADKLGRRYMLTSWNVWRISADMRAGKTARMDFTRGNLRRELDTGSIPFKGGWDQV